MDLLDAEKVEKEVKLTIEGLERKEAANTTSFNNWPKNEMLPYQLMPERRDSGVGEPSRSHLR